MGGGVRRFDACTVPTPGTPPHNATGATDLGSFPSATFRLTFDTGSYFEAIGTEAFYPGNYNFEARGRTLKSLNRALLTDLAIAVVLRQVVMLCPVSAQSCTRIFACPLPTTPLTLTPFLHSLGSGFRGDDYIQSGPDTGPLPRAPPPQPVWLFDLPRQLALAGAC